MDADTKRLVAAVRRDIVDTDNWTEWPGGWPGQIEMCLVDAIYSANARYGSPATAQHEATGVHRVLAALRQVRGDGTLDDLHALRAALRSGPAPVLRNEQRSPGTSVLKEVNLLRVSEALTDAGVSCSAALDEYLRTAREEERRAWWPRHREFGRIAGVADQTWEYFLMLSGHTGVKADRMIRRYVARALDPESTDIPAERAAELVRKAARNSALNCKAHRLDHAIWAFESGNLRKLPENPSPTDGP